MRRILSIFRKIGSHPWTPNVFSLTGGMLYLAQSLDYAFKQISVLDEGAYLYKGLLFVTGQYVPFQDYGPWTNHMPLSFIIPGFIQWVFGPGLRTGRYFAILLGLVMLVGLWLTVRRQAGNWWAAFAVLVIALNPAIIKMYSTAVSQVLIACMFIWCLFFTLGKDRKHYQIILGSILAGIMLMTRINLAPVLPLLVLYVYWQFGVKAGWKAALSGGLVVLVGHALFWPGILRMWAYWLPEEITPFLANWRPIGVGIRYWNPDISLPGRVLSFFHMIRHHFVITIGTFSTWLLWPKKVTWKDRSDYKSAIYLSAIFLSLLAIHMWATLGKNYCVFCLGGYVAFFASAGLLLVITTFPVWRRHVTGTRLVIISIFIIALFTGTGYGAFEDIGIPLVNLPLPNFLPGLTQVQGIVTLGKLLQNIFDLERSFLRRILPTITGLGTGVIILSVALVTNRYIIRRRTTIGLSIGYLAILISIVFGFLLSPTRLLGGGYRTYDCNSNVIVANEDAGLHLTQYIPSGSSVYWKGGLSATPLLYLGEVKIFPAQLNGDYSFYIKGDPDSLMRYGFWNQELAEQWTDEADFLLIQERYYEGWLREKANDDTFVELDLTPSTIPCQDDAQIHIFQRIP